MLRRNSGKAFRDRFLQELEPVQKGLLRTALRMTQDPQKAEDLLQDTVLKAYRFFDTFKLGTNFRAWVFRVLYTVFVNGQRHTSSRPVTLEGLPEAAWTSGPLTEELDRPSHQERVRAVMEAVDDKIKQAVDSLPPDLRLAFLLSTVEGLKYREIAQVLGCPLGTVMSRLFRSRKMLQERLATYNRETHLRGRQESGAEGVSP